MGWWMSRPAAAPKIVDLEISNKDLHASLDKLLQNPSYPTRSLNFLKNLQKNGYRQGTTLPVEPLILNILIVGGGLGGLSTAIALARRGHKVQVLEQASRLGEVGAGIQIPSNSSRILLEWGLGPHLAGKVVEPDGITFRRWKDGDPIGYTRLIPDFVEKYKAPYFVVHRADFHNALHQRALELGVDVQISHKVVAYDESLPSVTLANGRTLHADLVVAADGLKSIARACIPGETAKKPTHTGFAAYRATVSVSALLEDPDTAWLLEKPALNVWIGEDRHVMTYTIASGKSFNMVLSHVDSTHPSTWKAERALEDMRAYFKGWDPKIVKVINKIETTVKWPLMSLPPMNNWLSPSKRLVVLGDAAHAMVPYMSQGAAMAVEDGAALAEALSHADTTRKLGTVLEIFDRVRRKRSNAMQQASLINGKIWHFADGPEQEARDFAMRPEVVGEAFEESPNQWSDPDTQMWAYGYDAVDAIAREFR